MERTRGRARERARAPDDWMRLLSCRSLFSSFLLSGSSETQGPPGRDNLIYQAGALPGAYRPHQLVEFNKALERRFGARQEVAVLRAGGIALAGLPPMDLPNISPPNRLATTLFGLCSLVTQLRLCYADGLVRCSTFLP